MLKRMNWDEMFGASSFAFKNIRRKADARAYPSRLEFGLKRGIVPPAALNNGEQVDLLVGRIAAPYYDAQTFDDLPTPFRAVSMDLLTATRVVLDRGLAGLGDAGDDVAAADLSAGAARRAGAGRRRRHGQRAGGRRQGRWAPRESSRSTSAIWRTSRRPTPRCSGWPAQTLDAMMRANTKAAIKQADIIINVPLERIRLARLASQRRAHRGGLQGRRGDARQSAAAGGQRNRRTRAWKAGRAGAPADGASGAGVRSRGRLQPGRREPLQQICSPTMSVWRSTSTCFKRELDAISGLDRYETITWRFVSNPAGETGVLVEARAEVVRSALPDAGSQPGEHDVGRLQADPDRALSRLRPARPRLRAAHRRHDRIGSAASASNCTSRSARPRCSSPRSRASPTAPSTSSRTMRSSRVTARP